MKIIAFKLGDAESLRDTADRENVMFTQTVADGELATSCQCATELAGGYVRISNVIREYRGPRVLVAVSAVRGLTSAETSERKFSEAGQDFSRSRGESITENIRLCEHTVSVALLSVVAGKVDEENLRTHQCRRGPI